MRNLFDRLRASPWVLLVVAFVIGACFPIWPAPGGGDTTMIPYVLSWLGGLAQAISGACAGWFFCRKVLRLDLSTVPEGLPRCVAGLGAAVVIGCFIIGVCVAV